MAQLLCKIGARLNFSWTLTEVGACQVSAVAGAGPPARTQAKDTSRLVGHRFFREECMGVRPQSIKGSDLEGSDFGGKGSPRGARELATPQRTFSRKVFFFKLLRTLLRSPKPQLFSFQATPHSLL